MRNVIINIILAMFVVSCTTENLTVPNDFKVTTNVKDTVFDTIVVAKGDTLYKKNVVVIAKGVPFTFNFAGDPDYITFFSGEKTHQYKYSGVTSRSADSVAITLKNQASIAYSATYQNTDVNTVKFKLSTDFSGTSDSASIVKAHWIDYSSNISIAPTSSAVSSRFRIPDSIIARKKPVYMAFEYVSDTIRTTILQPRSWNISAFTFNSYYPDRTYTPASTILEGGFMTSVSMKQPLNYWYLTSSATLFTVLNRTNTVGYAGDNNWIVSRAFDLQAVVTDYGTTVKSMNNTGFVTTYSYTFTTAGVYRVTFVASNQSINGAKAVTRELIVKVK